ncbi:hypothetical protein DN745_09025 [Bradymonas sediminis]|uniref:Uncharacterized protein n=1 Tax=Bradymonas sediminis TaxID=1548548 RepID=A0A2Z4FLA6_9DELT|nr:hypothetical protein DN745_09025 [Bradymonas sediminis]
MEPFKQKPAAWKGLNLAIVIAAGVLCLMASALADSRASSCAPKSYGAQPSNCHQTPQADHSTLQAYLAPSVRSNFGGAWAFILPGARAFSSTHISAPSRLEAPLQPDLRSEFADIPIYRIAPKNSDPQIAIFA